MVKKLLSDFLIVFLFIFFAIFIAKEMGRKKDCERSGGSYSFDFARCDHGGDSK
jgi:hypothetical protein